MVCCSAKIYFMVLLNVLVLKAKSSDKTGLNKKTGTHMNKLLDSILLPTIMLYGTVNFNLINHNA